MTICPQVSLSTKSVLPSGHTRLNAVLDRKLRVPVCGHKEPQGIERILDSLYNLEMVLGTRRVLLSVEHASALESARAPS